MSTTYEPISFDFGNKTINFKLIGLFNISITFETVQEMKKYELVNTKVHFRDIKGDIVLIRNREKSLSVRYKNETFIKARQWEYDRWLSKNYPDSINTKVYNKISKTNYISTVV